MSPKLIGLIAHTGKPNAAALVRALRESFQSKNAALRIESIRASDVELGFDQRLDQMSPELCVGGERPIVVGIADQRTVAVASGPDRGLLSSQTFTAHAGRRGEKPVRVRETDGALSRWRPGRSGMS